MKKDYLIENIRSFKEENGSVLLFIGNTRACNVAGGGGALQRCKSYFPPVKVLEKAAITGPKEIRTRLEESVNQSPVEREK